MSIVLKPPTYADGPATKEQAVERWHETTKHVVSREALKALDARVEWLTVFDVPVIQLGIGAQRYAYGFFLQRGKPFAYLLQC